MEVQLLKDPLIRPEDNVLESVLGEDYSLYKEFAGMLSEKKLILEWNYYNDGKSWLCKVLNKKKNIGWLSVWDTGFKMTIFFTEKTIGGMLDLDINSEIKKNATEIKHVGKLIPVLLLIKNKDVMADAIKLLDYKMALK